MANVKTTARFAAGKIPLMSLSLGPVASADVSEGVATYPWSVWVSPDGSIKMQKADVPLTEGSLAPEFMPDNGAGWSGISLSFDQNARRVVAFEDSGTIYISQIIVGPSESRVTFAGHDPQLFWDGRILPTQHSTDVFCMYLSADRLSICWRLQSENYAVEHIWATLSTPSSLDKIAMAAYQLVAWTTDQSGVTTRTASQLYPLIIEDGATFSTALTGGELFETIIVRDTVTDGALFNTALTGGSLNEVIIVRDTVIDGVSLNTTLSAGAYTQVIVLAPDITTDGALFTTVLDSGTYVEVIQSAGDTVTDGALFSTTLTGGSYV